MSKVESDLTVDAYLVVMEAIRKDVGEYYAEFQEPMSLRFLAQRYAKRLRGMELMDLIRMDPWFEWFFRVKTGGRVIFPRKAFAEQMEAVAKLTGKEPHEVRAKTLAALGVKVL